MGGDRMVKRKEVELENKENQDNTSWVYSNNDFSVVGFNKAIFYLRVTDAHETVLDKLEVKIQGKSHTGDYYDIAKFSEVLGNASENITERIELGDNVGTVSNYLLDKTIRVGWKVTDGSTNANYDFIVAALFSE